MPDSVFISHKQSHLIPDRGRMSPCPLVAMLFTLHPLQLPGRLMELVERVAMRGVGGPSGSADCWGTG